MWNEVFNLALKNGLWAVLFLGLFIFVIKDSSAREKKYQQTIKDLTEHLGVVKEIKDDVDEIKNIVLQKNIAKSNKKTSKKSTRVAFLEQKPENMIVDLTDVEIKKTKSHIKKDDVAKNNLVGERDEK